MLIPMTTTPRPQRRYDHRLRDLVLRTGDVSFATDLGVPRFDRAWGLGAVPPVVASLDVADLTEPERRQEILRLRRRVRKLAALLRLVLALLQASGTVRERPTAKKRILRAVDQTCACRPLRALLQFVGLSPSRFHAWRRQQTACFACSRSPGPSSLPPCLVAIDISMAAPAADPAARNRRHARSEARTRPPGRL